MFRWRGQRRETKKQKAKEQKSKQLWGRDFNIVENGLNEKQVVSFVGELEKQSMMAQQAGKVLTYPVMILGAVVVVLLIVMAMPQLLGMLTAMNIELPLPASILDSTVTLASTYQLYFLIALVLLVATLVLLLAKQHKTSSSASVRSVLKTAVADAEQIVASIKMKAQTEAEEEAARIIAKANEEAEVMKRETETAAEKEAEGVLSVAKRESEITEVEAKQEEPLEAGEKVETEKVEEPPEVGEKVETEKVEEPPEVGEKVETEKVEEPPEVGEKVETEKVEEPPEVGEKVETEKVEEPLEVGEKVETEKVEEPVQLRKKATVSEPVAAATEEFLEQHFPEEKPDIKETELDLLKQDSHSLYTGEVELVISMPVDPKMVSKLYNYLQTTPEIKLIHTSGSWDRGTTITVVLDKPISLISVLSSKIPEAEVTPERPEKDGYVKGKRGVRRIKLALKEV